MSYSEDETMPFIDFLDSDIVSLKAEKSERSFKIHRKLLASVCTTVTSALDKFQEGQNGSYTFEDTSEGTLARFIEWAYTRGYADVIKPTEPAEQKAKKLEAESKGEGEQKAVMTTAQLALTTENHPLLVHINLYIFSSIYVIPDICDFVFDEIITCFEELDKPDTLDTQLAVISALRLAFSKLPSHDRLLSWMARYAAYCIDQLRMQGSFHDLLVEVPVLSSRIVLSLKSASDAPWDIEEPKHKYPQYNPGTGYEETYYD